MAVGATTAEISEALAQYYDKLLIEREKPMLRLMQFAQKRPLPKNMGTTAYFTGYRPLAKPSSALTEGSTPTAVNFAARQISATIAEWGQTAKMTSLLDMTKIDPGLEEQIDIVAMNAAQTLDYQLSKTVAKTGIWGIVSNHRTSNQATITVSNSASNSTSIFQTTAATTVNAYSAFGTKFKGAVVTVVKDGLTSTSSTVKYGYCGRVSSYLGSTTAGDKFRLVTAAPNAAAPEAFQSSDRIRITCHSNIGSTDVVSNTLFAMAQRDLIVTHANRFADGYYGGVIPAQILYSLKLDSTWVAASQYSDVTNLYAGEVGKWYGHRIVESTQPYRESGIGVESEDAGTSYFSFFIGRNAFGHTDLGGGPKKIHVVRGPDTNEPIPRNTYVSWYHPYAQKALTAPWCVGLISGASA